MDNPTKTARFTPDNLPPKGHPDLYLSLLRESDEYREQIENEIEELLAQQTGYNDSYSTPKPTTAMPIQVFDNLQKIVNRSREIGETEKETLDRKQGITRRTE